jgi:hypothetical protein
LLRRRDRLWAWDRLGSATLGSFGFWQALMVAFYARTELLLPVVLALRERRMRRSGRPESVNKPT